MKYKICKNCNIKLEESLDNFYFSKSKNKFESKCKKCQKLFNKIYHENNKEKVNKKNRECRDNNINNIKAQRKKYYKNNREKILEKQNKYAQNNKKNIQEYHKEYYKNNKENLQKNSINYYNKNKEKIKTLQKRYYNKEKRNEYNKEYYKNNKKGLNEYRKKYYKNNKEKLIKLNNIYTKKRRKNDAAYKLNRLISNKVYIALKEIGQSKNGNSIIKFLGYAKIQLKFYIEYKFEYWMNWKNHGIYNAKTWNDNDPSTWTWQLDHIIPHSEFRYTSMEDEEFKKCWSLENLRPYSAKQNILDGNRR